MVHSQCWLALMHSKCIIWYHHKVIKDRYTSHQEAKRRSYSLTVACKDKMTLKLNDWGENRIGFLTSWAHNVGEGRVTPTAQALAICVRPHKSSPTAKLQLTLTSSCHRTETLWMHGNPLRATWHERKLVSALDSLNHAKYKVVISVNRKKPEIVRGNWPGLCRRQTPCRSTCRAVCVWDTRPCCAGTVVDASSSPHTYSHSKHSLGDTHPGGSGRKEEGLYS